MEEMQHEMQPILTNDRVVCP